MIKKGERKTDLKISAAVSLAAATPARRLVAAVPQAALRHAGRGRAASSVPHSCSALCCAQCGGRSASAASCY